MKLAHRADIDGLRAIAVLAVILGHAGLKMFAGGFVGVDIFFVISGYLITSILLAEIERNEFSLVKFYERRIRRIFPALFVALAATLIFSWWLLGASEFRAVGSSLIATTLFSSNILFWTQSGYFDATSGLKPLLHTWSLGVEEQFYIVYPLLLAFLVRRARPALFLTLLSISLASFGLDIYKMNDDPSGAFYLTHLRIWELLIGSLLALNVIPTEIKLPLRNLLGLLGLAMITIPVFLYTENTSFPGPAAAIPAVGAALIIQSGREAETWAGRVLSFWPLVFIGQISYSLYLWHWPVFVLSQHYALIELTAAETGAALAAIFILSTLSWQFVEKPFRQKTVFKGNGIFAFAGVVMLLTMAIGSAVYLSDGFPARFSAEQASIISELDAKWEKGGSCDLFIERMTFPPKFCSVGADANTPTFMLWGDSHARAVAPAIQISAAKAGVSGLVASAGGCPPLLEINLQGQASCNEFNATVINYIREHQELTTIILAGRWAKISQGTPYKAEGGKSEILVDPLTGLTHNDTNAAPFSAAFDLTIKTLLEMGREVVIVSQVPEVGYEVPALVSIARRTGRDLNITIAPKLSEYLARNSIAMAAIELAAQNDNVQVIEPWKVLCNEQTCLVVVDGQALYRDGNHLSIFGAHYIAYIFDAVFENLAAR